MTAGYPATPQARKLGLKPGLRVALVGAPDGWTLQDPPPLDAADADGSADLVVWFIRAAAEFDDVPRHGRAIFPAGSLWIAWPRRAAGHVSDVTDTAVREAVLPLGLVDVKVAALDEDWSALKVVWRLERRR